MKDIGSKNFERRDCNCSSLSRENGVCIFGNNCRELVVVYKATHVGVGNYYIGCTQQKVKKRFDGHFSEVCNYVNKGMLSDSFAKYFGSVLKDMEKEGRTTRKDIREIVRVEVLWKGNPISVMKTFGQVNCTLCMKERLAIVKAMRKEPHKLINSSTEIYGTCRHKTQFHRFTNYNTSTERVYRVSNLRNVRNQNSNIEDSQLELCVTCSDDECTSPLSTNSQSAGSDNNTAYDSMENTISSPIESEISNFENSENSEITRLEV
jgi:hypothetical protein